MGSKYRVCPNFLLLTSHFMFWTYQGFKKSLVRVSCRGGVYVGGVVAHDPYIAILKIYYLPVYLNYHGLSTMSIDNEQCLPV